MTHHRLRSRDLERLLRDRSRPVDEWLTANTTSFQHTSVTPQSPLGTHSFTHAPGYGRALHRCTVYTGLAKVETGGGGEAEWLEGSGQDQTIGVAHIMT